MGDVVKLPSIRPGARIRTVGWDTKTDRSEFTVVEVFPDGWVRAEDDQGLLRMFDRLVCRPVNKEA